MQPLFYTGKTSADSVCKTCDRITKSQVLQAFDSKVSTTFLFLAFSFKHPERSSVVSRNIQMDRLFFDLSCRLLRHRWTSQSRPNHQLMIFEVLECCIRTNKWYLFAQQLSYLMNGYFHHLELHYCTCLN